MVGLALLAITWFPAAAEQKTARLTVLPDKVIGEISPRLYGQFIEHIETCIYNGIWSEMILDRKFYYAVGEKGLSPWSAVGKEGVSMENDLTCGDAMSVRLAPDSGIRQQGITLEARGYTGSFWAAAPEGHAEVRVTLRTGKESAQIFIPIHSHELEKYEFSLRMTDGGEYGFFEILCQSGTVALDSISLMPDDHIGGMRADTLAQLTRLNAAFYRWPGGNFVSGYDWKDGIGDRDWRVSKRNLHYLGLETDFKNEAQMKLSDRQRMTNLKFYGAIEPNDFGMDEFLSLCRYLRAEPMVIVNSGLGTVEDAADAVEYLNGGAETEWGRKRQQNGHAEPYRVTMFGIGNEMFGDWQLGHMDISEYAGRHRAFAEAMLARDPDIMLIGVGDNTQNWTRNMLLNNAGYIDATDEHLYSQRFEGNVVAHVSGVESNLGQRLRKHRSIIGANREARDVSFMLLEYAYDKVTSPSRLKDGLGIGVFMNTLIKNADIAKAAAYSSTVNATQGCVTTTDTAAVMQASGFVLSLYRREMESIAIECRVACDDYLNVSAAINPDTGRITIAVVNPNAEAIGLSCPEMENADIVRYSMEGDSPEAYNTALVQKIRETREENSWEAPPYSASIFVVTE